MSDIELYQKSAGEYDVIQNTRPDYTGALKTFVDLVGKYINQKGEIDVADFCAGTGHNTKLIADRFDNVGKALLIDINKEFLEIAKNSKIKAQEVIFLQSDILKADFAFKANLVISMFAYHHIPDDKKILYLEQAKKALKPGGLVFLGEIYSPNKATTIRYYEKLLEAIPKDLQTEDLKRFLTQTANSDDFEYKVSKGFADNQFIEFGFKCLESIKIWPKDNSLGDNIGTFVEVWQLQ